MQIFDDAVALTFDECLARLPAAGMGHVALSVKALPLVVPTPFRVTRDGVTFQPPNDRRLVGAIEGTIVSFVAEGVDERGVTWSVAVIGPARLHSAGQELRDHIEVFVPFQVVVGRRFDSLLLQAYALPKLGGG